MINLNPLAPYSTYIYGVVTELLTIQTESSHQIPEKQTQGQKHTMKLSQGLLIKQVA